MTPDALAIRADASPRIGAGHVMRCVALADAWRRSGGRVDWFCRPLPPMLTALVESRTAHTHVVGEDWNEIASWSLRHPGGWVCIDGYEFAAGPSRVRAAGGRAFVLADDRRWGHYECDALLNQVVGAERLAYDIAPQALLMLGSRYCLLRDEFLALSPAPPRERVSRVFVSFGGHDDHQQGIRVIELLAVLHSQIQFDVAAGLMSTESAAPAHPNVTWHTASDLSRIMRAADVAIVAAGSVCWELAYLGIPAIVMVVADNQEPIADGVDAAGLAHSLGWFNSVTDTEIVTAFESLLGSQRRMAMSTRGRQVIDGHGADRVVRTLRQGALA